MGQTELIDSVLTAVSPGETEQLLIDLIAIESHSGIQDQEAEIACFIRDWLSERGIECWLSEVLPGRPNVIARLTGDGTGPSLVFNGHLDTVPPYGMNSPFKALNKEGKWYGRGSVDMKGALAAMLSALVAIKRNGVRLYGDIFFAGTIGEESYSPGAYQLSRSGFEADYAIVGEPTGLKTGIAHKGVAWYEAEFPGRSVHGSVPEQGVNAIYRASRWIEHIQDRYLPMLKERSHPLLGSPSMNIGTIEGGTRTVTVPSRCTIGFERRLIPGETAESALLEYKATLEAVREEHPDFQGDIRIADNFHGVPHCALETPPDSPLAAALSSAYEDEFYEEATSRSDVLIGLQFWTDGALLQKCCKHTVVCGPGNIEQAHSDDEYIEERQLHAATRVYIRTAVALCAR